MKKELQDRLLQDYKEIFQGHLPIDVEDGWFDLLNILCGLIRDECERKKISIKVVQIKEKFGGLRFYSDYIVDEKIEGFIEFAETLSYYICEQCGKKGSQTTDGGWMLTLCESCKHEQGRR